MWQLWGTLLCTAAVLCSSYEVHKACHALDSVQLLACNTVLACTLLLLDRFCCEISLASNANRGNAFYPCSEG
jgi:heme/copper-type cytochrome/quinol oxidase subunit 3